jgi:heme exporter protein A
VHDESPAIEARGLSRRFGRRWALAEVDFRVRRGGTVMVTGRNGSGKSTLLRVLATAIRADAGSARVAGHDIRREKEQVRRRVSLLGHELYLYQALSGLENLELWASFLGRGGGRTALLGHLEEVGLASRAGDPVSTYSAGMRKRLALARTLLQEASVVLLDEPGSGLDPDGLRLVDALLARWRENGVTVLMATHQPERGSLLCDEELVLEEGRLRRMGPVGPAREDAPRSGAGS